MQCILITLLVIFIINHSCVKAVHSENLELFGYKLSFLAASWIHKMYHRPAKRKNKKCWNFNLFNLSFMEIRLFEWLSAWPTNLYDNNIGFKSECKWIEHRKLKSNAIKCIPYLVGMIQLQRENVILCIWIMPHASTFVGFCVSM